MGPPLKMNIGREKGKKAAQREDTHGAKPTHGNLLGEKKFDVLEEKKSK